MMLPQLAFNSDSVSCTYELNPRDLKTSITSIKLFADIMLNDVDALNKDSATQYLSIIKAESDRMAHTLARNADYQHMLSNALVWNEQETDVIDVIKRCASAFRVLASTKSIDFDVKLDLEKCVTMMDEDRLRRLVWCLMENALRFTKHGGIKLDVDCKDVAGSPNIQITIEDSGSGIPENQLARLFAFDAKSDADRLKGGMGLYVAKNIVDHYQGEIRVESRGGEGSVFSVMLPLHM